MNERKQLLLILCIRVGWVLMLPLQAYREGDSQLKNGKNPNLTFGNAQPTKIRQGLALINSFPIIPVSEHHFCFRIHDFRCIHSDRIHSNDGVLLLLPVVPKSSNTAERDSCPADTVSISIACSVAKRVSQRRICWEGAWLQQ